MNQPSVLVVLGFLIGGAITFIWELKASPAGAPAGAEAAALVDDADSAPVRSVERVRAPSVSSRNVTRSDQSAAPVRNEPRAAPVQKSANEEKAAADTRKPNATARRVSDDAAEAAHAPPPPPPMTRVSEANRSVAIHVNRVLVGGQLISSGILQESVLEQHGRENKYIVYFDLSVVAEGDQPDVHLNHEDFRLEDSVGMIYPPLGVPGQLSAVLHKGETGRGGVAYAVHNDSAPARLHFRTRDQTYTPLPTSIFEPGSHSGLQPGA